MGVGQRRVVLVAYDGFQLLDIAGPADVFDAATRGLRGEDEAVLAGNWEPPQRTSDSGGERTGYELVVATPGGRDVRANGGLAIRADAALEKIDRAGVDTVIVSGAPFLGPALADARLLDQIERISGGARRTCSVCSGALLLAAAGVLDGRRATTHWAACGELARRHPRVTVEPDRIYVRDGAVYTSAGVTAGMDLALALAGEDHGPWLARKVARWLVLFLQRPGGQSQFSERLSLPLGSDSPIRALLDDIVADPAADHSVPELARRAAVSERHLARLFTQDVRTTPGRFVERVRVEAARGLLESTRSSVDAVAASSGFGSAETMRRAFVRILGVGPGEYRRRFSPRETVLS